MENNEKKNKIQMQAVKAWLKNNKKGTLEIITGLGKTFCALHALYEMPKDDKIHLFLAEVKDRKKDLYEDILKYNEIFNRDVLKDYNFKFKCYQGVYKKKNLKLGLVIADEIHDACTPSYSKFFKNNSYDALIGLSATIDRNTSYKTESKVFTKGEILDSICPVVYKYGFKKAYKEGTTRKLKVNIIHHELDKTKKVIKSGGKKNSFYQTEEKAYKYWSKRHAQSWFIFDSEKKKLMIRITAKKRNDILYKLASKVEEVKKLTNNINTRSILFGNDINSLLKITPNTISSYNKDEENSYIRKQFENGKINLIASFKKLKQGANLPNIDNCIIMSYYSSSKDLIQRIGRLRDNGNLGNIFIFVTKETQEEIWFTKMFENFNNVKTVVYNNVEEYLKNK